MSLNNLIEQLPRHSEEGNFASEKTRENLIRSLQQSLESDEVAQAQLLLLEQLLQTFSLLDEERLEAGYWRFPSYPANLAALSLLSAVAEPSQRYLPYHFWQGGQVADPVKEQQRQILKNIEDSRVEQSKQLNPIRTVHVAWAIIKLNGRFLLHRREDTKIRYEADAGDYNLPGGRCNFADLRQQIGSNATVHDLLDMLQKSRNPMLKKTLQEQTLPRELSEEIGLVIKQDYVIDDGIELPEWWQCQGTAPSYAYSRYYLTLYIVHLTTLGFLNCLDKIEQDITLFMADVNELQDCRSRDGTKTFYLQALSNPEIPNGIISQLDALPDSYQNQYFETNKEYIFFNDKIIVDIKGNQSSLDIHLSQDEFGWMQLLAAHAKDFTLEKDGESKLNRYRFGWIRLQDEAMFELLLELSERLNRNDTHLLEIIPSEKLVRIALNPAQIFFDDSLFYGQILKQGRQYQFSLYRKTFSMLPGWAVRSDHFDTTLPEITLGPVLWQLVQGKPVEDNDLPKKVRSKLQYLYHPLGIIRLLGTERGSYRFNCLVSTDT